MFVRTLMCLLQVAALSDVNLVEKLQLCVNYSGSSWVPVLSKCAMMTVYSVEETRDNIQLLMDHIKEMLPQVNTAEIYVETEWRERFK